MTEVTFPTELVATMQHAELLRDRIERLTEALGDTLGQLEVAITRAEPTMAQSDDLWAWAKTLNFPGASIRVAKACGSDVSRLSQWLRHGPPQEITGPVRGTFPVDMQLTPRKGKPCVYLLFVGNEVVYVGFSENVKLRLRSHWRDRRAEYTGWEIIPCPTERDAYALEGDLIFQHQPRLNSASRNRRRYTA